MSEMLLFNRKFAHINKVGIIENGILSFDQRGAT